MEPERRHTNAQTSAIAFEDKPGGAAAEGAAENAAEGDSKEGEGGEEGDDSTKVPTITAKSLLKHKPEDLSKINDEHMNAVLKKSARAAEDSHEELTNKHKSLVDLAAKLEAKAVHHLEE